MFHIFRECPKLRPLWQDVANTIKHLTNVNLVDDPAACLLHLSRWPKTFLTIHLLNVAKAYTHPQNLSGSQKLKLN